MNDWDIKNLFRFIIVIQTILWISAGLNSFYVHIPVVSEVSAFISLIFINGVLILRILRIHGLGNIETLLYSVGLSIASLMFLGMIIDLIYPLFGIQKPISLIPLLITFTLFTVFLSVLSYYRDGNYKNSVSLSMDIEGLTTPTLFLFLIPFLAIFGTYAVNHYNNNSILMIMFGLFACMPLLVAYDRVIPKKLYPLAIFTISIALLLSTSLISNHITGWDIHAEFYFSNLVATYSYWDFSIPELLNAMLSLVIIVPIFSKISGLSVIDIFKIIYPIIFALVPVGLYSIFQRQTNKKIAFFSCFLFISVFMFFLEMTYLARQEIGELFFILIMMLIVEDKVSKNNLNILTLFFIPALLVSHYSMDYIYIFLLISAYTLILIRKLNLADKIPVIGSWEIIRFFLAKDDSEKDTKKIDYRVQLLLIIGITAVYYILVSSSALLFSTVSTLDNLITMGSKFLFNPSSLMAIGIVTSEKTLLRSIALVIHLLIELFIGIGILMLINRRTGMKFNENYSIFSVMSFFMLILVLIVPFLAGALNPERFYQIALIFLSVFFVVGWIGSFNLLNRILRFRWKKKSVYRNSLKLIAIFLGISLIFNSGAVYEIFGDKPTSMSLHNTMDGPKFNEMEIKGAQWLSEFKTNNTILADQYRFLLLNGFNHYNNNRVLINEIHINQSSYVYFGSFNILHDQYGVSVKGSNVLKYYPIGNLTSFRSRIFDDGDSQIYHY